MKTNKNKKRILAILLVLILLISVGYAALTTNLSINGTAIFKKQTWNVYFDNVQIKTGSVSGAKVIAEPTTSGTTTKDLTWEVSLDTPGEFYEYNVDIVNGGTIDAMVETETNMIVTSQLTEEQAKYLDYSIKYINGADIEQFDKLAAGERKTITVKLVLKNDDSVNPSDLPQTAQNGISFNYEANYIQADDRAVEKRTGLLQIGDTVDYSTTLNGVTLNNWKVFYVDGDYTYIILDDFLPNVAFDTTNMTGIYKSGTYVINSNGWDRTYLLNALSTKSNWDGLLTGTLNGTIEVNEARNANVWAMGSPNLELWTNSWNTVYPNDKIYIKYENNAIGDYATGYYVGFESNPSTVYISLRTKEGYNNKLYYPHQKNLTPECFGYWIASPSAYHEDSVSVADTYGNLDATYLSNSYAFRPVICMPSDVLNQ